VFNVRYIDQLAHWIALQQFDFVYWNMMHDAWYFSIANLPIKAKTAIADYLRQAMIPVTYRNEFDRIIDFMMNGSDTDGVQMLREMKKLDQRRGQNLAQVAPELAELIDYEQA
jgi:hypothetical protein